MKIRILLLIVALVLAACNTDQFAKADRENEFEKMCSYETMIICGDDLPIEGNGSKVYLETYTPVGYNIDGRYHFMRDPMTGMCVDYVITMLELNIRSGYIKRGEARWISGLLEGEPHAWLLVKGRDLYDSNYPRGLPIEEAYNKHNYERRFTIYSY